MKVGKSTEKKLMAIILHQFSKNATITSASTTGLVWCDQLLHSINERKQGELNLKNMLNDFYFVYIQLRCYVR